MWGGCRCTCTDWWVHSWRLGVRRFLHCFPSYLLRQGPWLNVTVTGWLDPLVRDPLRSSGVHLPVLRLQAYAAMPGFFLYEFWESELSYRPRLWETVFLSSVSGVRAEMFKKYYYVWIVDCAGPAQALEIVLIYWNVLSAVPLDKSLFLLFLTIMHSSLLNSEWLWDAQSTQLDFMWLLSIWGNIFLGVIETIEWKQPGFRQLAKELRFH